MCIRDRLTPVQSVGGLLFKRDDLYEPFGPGEVNGGKMRQCMMLLDSVKDEITGVISCCLSLIHISPSYEERLEMLRTISPRVKRTIVRIQPFMHEVLQDVLKNLPRVKAAGAHGVVVEGMKFAKAKPGLVRVGGD